MIILIKNNFQKGTKEASITLLVCGKSDCSWILYLFLRDSIVVPLKMKKNLDLFGHIHEDADRCFTKYLKITYFGWRKDCGYDSCLLSKAKKRFPRGKRKQSCCVLSHLRGKLCFLAIPTPDTFLQGFSFLPTNSCHVKTRDGVVQD